MWFSAYFLYKLKGNETQLFTQLKNYKLGKSTLFIFYPPNFYDISATSTCSWQCKLLIQNSYLDAFLQFPWQFFELNPMFSALLDQEFDRLQNAIKWRNGVCNLLRLEIREDSLREESDNTRMNSELVLVKSSGLLSQHSQILQLWRW